MVDKLHFPQDGYNPSKKAIHIRLRIRRGPANENDCVDCKKEALDWSWIHDTDPDDLMNYEPRCRRCHVLYDKPWLKSGNLLYVPSEE